MQNQEDRQLCYLYVTLEKAQKKIFVACIHSKHKDRYNPTTSVKDTGT